MKAFFTRLLRKENLKNWQGLYENGMKEVYIICLSGQKPAKEKIKKLFQIGMQHGEDNSRKHTYSSHPENEHPFNNIRFGIY